MRRSVVPEFPASSTVIGSVSPCRPFPVTISSFSFRNSTVLLSARITWTVERQSAAWRKLRICTGVSPSPANMTLRCEMDLSPGISTAPRHPCRAASIVFISAIHLCPFQIPYTVAAGSMSHRKRCLQIVAARIGIYIDQFADEIEMLHKF